MIGVDTVPGANPADEEWMLLLDASTTTATPPCASPEILKMLLTSFFNFLPLLS